MRNDPNRIPSLDGLRGVALLVVLFSHLVGTKNFISPAADSCLYEFGNLSLKVFFVMSGYLITNLLLHELETKKRIHLVKFYFRRTFRIFPPYYMMILGLVIMGFAGWINLTPRDVLSALTYTSNYHPDRSWNIGHTWSLSVEEQFYLLWPAVLVILGKRRGFIAASTLIFICPIIRALLWHFYRLDGIGHRFETVADSIATGCLLAGTREWLKAQPLYRKMLESKLFILVPITVLSFNMLYNHPMIFYFISHTVMNIGIALCVDWCVTYHTGRVGSVLNSRPLVFIGLISYSTYLWQQLFLNRYSSSMIAQFPINIILVVIAGLGSYFLVEKPSLGLRHRLEKRLFARRKDKAEPTEFIPMLEQPQG